VEPELPIDEEPPPRTPHVYFVRVFYDGDLKQTISLEIARQLVPNEVLSRVDLREWHGPKVRLRDGIEHPGDDGDGEANADVIGTPPLGYLRE